MATQNPPACQIFCHFCHMESALRFRRAAVHEANQTHSNAHRKHDAWPQPGQSAPQSPTMRSSSPQHHGRLQVHTWAVVSGTLRKWECLTFKSEALRDLAPPRPLRGPPTRRVAVAEAHVSSSMDLNSESVDQTRQIQTFRCLRNPRVCSGTFPTLS